MRPLTWTGDMHRQSTLKRVVIFGASVLLGLWTFAGVAAAAPAPTAGGRNEPSDPHAETSAHVTECSPTHHSNTGHGANTDGDDNPYHNTCEHEHAPGNGKGDGTAAGKPCAGCVGNADDKNPPGQAPGGSDGNAGYECDRNQGVGKENPAHTGCGESSETGTQVVTVKSENTEHTEDTEVAATGDTKTDAAPSAATLASAVNATAGVPAASAPPGRPAEVLGVQLSRSDAAQPATNGRPAEVLGVQYERSAQAGLARTGGSFLPLVSAGGLLVAIGTVLSSVRRREDVVSVNARLAGHGIAA